MDKTCDKCKRRAEHLFQFTSDELCGGCFYEMAMGEIQRLAQKLDHANRTVERHKEQVAGVLANLEDARKENARLMKQFGIAIDHKNKHIDELCAALTKAEADKKLDDESIKFYCDRWNSAIAVLGIEVPRHTQKMMDDAAAELQRRELRDAETNFDLWRKIALRTMRRSDAWKKTAKKYRLDFLAVRHFLDENPNALGRKLQDVTAREASLVMERDHWRHLATSSSKDCSSPEHDGTPLDNAIKRGDRLEAACLAMREALWAFINTNYSRADEGERILFTSKFTHQDINNAFKARSMYHPDNEQMMARRRCPGRVHGCHGFTLTFNGDLQAVNFCGHKAS